MVENRKKTDKHTCTNQPTNKKIKKNKEISKYLRIMCLLANFTYFAGGEKNIIYIYLKV